MTSKGSKKGTDSAQSHIYNTQHSGLVSGFAWWWMSIALKVREIKGPRLRNEDGKREKEKEKEIEREPMLFTCEKPETRVAVLKRKKGPTCKKEKPPKKGRKKMWGNSSRVRIAEMVVVLVVVLIAERRVGRVSPLPWSPIGRSTPVSHVRKIFEQSLVVVG